MAKAKANADKNAGGGAQTKTVGISSDVLKKLQRFVRLLSAAQDRDVSAKDVVDEAVVEYIEQHR